MVDFFKMQGAGNDFILFDNRSLKLGRDAMPLWAKTLCRRAFSIGADGLVFLDAPGDRPGADYVWHFYNADGSRAEMCGNASRCAAKLAVALGLADPKHVLGTDSGLVAAEMLPDGRVKVALTEPRNLALDMIVAVGGEDLDVHFVDTGVPHAVLFYDDVDLVDLAKLGPAVRFHSRFAPKGTNVNFVERESRARFRIRTYERGVEGETYACGTGAAAAVVVANALDMGDAFVELTATGGEQLAIQLENGRPHLIGPAVLVFEGRFDPDKAGL